MSFRYMHGAGRRPQWLRSDKKQRDCEWWQFIGLFRGLDNLG